MDDRNKGLNLRLVNLRLELYFRKYQKRLVEIMEGYILQIKSRILEIAKTGFIVPMTKTEMASQNVGRKLMI